MYDLDLAQFDKIAALLDKYKIGVEGAQSVWVDMFEEAKVILYREIDYLAEAENTKRFAENFNKVRRRFAAMCKLKRAPTASTAQFGMQIRHTFSPFFGAREALEHSSRLGSPSA